MSAIVNFYRCDATDSEGRMLAERWTWPDEDLEISHDFIQWMFPTAERSRFNPDVPIPTRDDIAAFRIDANLRASLDRSFTRILAFIRLAPAGTGEVVEAPNFAGPVPDVWAATNRNWLRITRVLSSLGTLGLECEARQFYDRLEQLYSSRQFPITAETFNYWTQAVPSTGP